ncbi:MAG: quinolinate synthase NadA [bacterium]
MADSLVSNILKLKKERQAVILAHNYQLPEVQDIADYVGDSLGLSIQAGKVEAKVIIFCGVNFMAETAAIISPDKKVVLPELRAGCPMADMITAEKLRNLKKQNPKAPVVCYVNSTAEVKAESDVCCTSANAGKVVHSLLDNEIIFVPDKYLGAFAQKQNPDKKLILYEGYCPTHAKILLEHIQGARVQWPGASVIVHPECRPEVIEAADAALSTEGLMKYVKESKNKEFIVGTETGMIYRLQKENPDKKFYPVTELAVCPNMKMINLEKILWALEEMKNVVTVPENIRVKASASINRMLEIGRPASGG